MQPTTRSRYNYENNPQAKGIRRTPSYLRFESAALSTQAQITFNVLKNEGTVGETEQRLAINDTFDVTDIAFYIIKATTAGQTRSCLPYTFPNSTVFSGSSEAANLQSIYNGSFSVKLNNVVWIPNMDMMNFYRVGGSQINVGTSTYDATNNPANKYLANSYDRMSYPFIPLDPAITLSGGWRNEIAVTLPTSINLAGTSSSNYLVCHVRGFLNQNASKLNA